MEISALPAALAIQKLNRFSQRLRLCRSLLLGGVDALGQVLVLRLDQ